MAETHDPKIRRLLAPNPSPMTHTGTNTYLLGLRDIAVIDPGPDNDSAFCRHTIGHCPISKDYKDFGHPFAS